MQPVYVTEESVLQLVLNLRSREIPDPDELHPQLLRFLADTISGPRCCSACPFLTLKFSGIEKILYIVLHLDMEIGRSFLTTDPSV